MFKPLGRLASDGKTRADGQRGCAARRLALAPERVVLEVSAESVDEAISQILDHVPPTALSDDRARIARQLVRAVGAGALRTHGGIAVVHAPLGGREPLLLFGRSDAGVPGPDDGSRVHALFLLLTPQIGSGSGRDAAARLGEMIDSEAIRERLLQAGSAAEIVEAVREGGLVAAG